MQGLTAMRCYAYRNGYAIAVPDRAEYSACAADGPLAPLCLGLRCALDVLRAWDIYLRTSLESPLWWAARFSRSRT